MRTEAGNSIDLFNSKYIRLASMRSYESASIFILGPAVVGEVAVVVNIYSNYLSYSLMKNAKTYLKVLTTTILDGNADSV